jgi:hypothetical protein
VPSAAFDLRSEAVAIPTPGDGTKNGVFLAPNKELAYSVHDSASFEVLHISRRQTLLNSTGLGSSRGGQADRLKIRGMSR